jgi:hypothetical protein
VTEVPALAEPGVTTKVVVDAELTGGAAKAPVTQAKARSRDANVNLKRIWVRMRAGLPFKFLIGPRSVKLYGGKWANRTRLSNSRSTKFVEASDGF